MNESDKLPEPPERYVQNGSAMIQTLNKIGDWIEAKDYNDLLAYCLALTADAARYRWLRKAGESHIIALTWKYPEACTTDDCDTAIDIAIAATKDSDD